MELPCTPQQMLTAIRAARHEMAEDANVLRKHPGWRGLTLRHKKDMLRRRSEAGEWLIGGGYRSLLNVRPRRAALLEWANGVDRWANEPIEPNYCGLEDAEGDAKRLGHKMACVARMAANLVD